MEATSTASSKAGGYDVARIRGEFPILDQEVNGRPLTYLDNAASTQKPVDVLNRVTEFYQSENANVHRGLHELSNRATDAYEQARVEVAGFFGIDDPSELIWTRGTTEGINLVASSLGAAVLKEDDEIVLSVMEHHSNLVPWQIAAQRTGARLKFFDIDEQGRLDLTAIEEVITERTKVVSIAQVSNALGTINPISTISSRAREVGAIMVVDGAQGAPHFEVSISALDCDFYAFSGHKMCAPTGIGGLWGRRKLLERLPPWMGGGDMIDSVELERSTWAPLPMKFEAGTPNIAGAVGLGAAARFLTSVGMASIGAHERDLVGYAIERLGELPEVTVFGPTDPRERSGVVSFVVDEVHPHDLATILDAEGVAIRAGHHCAQPLMRRLGVSATARASFYLYNTRAEVDTLIRGVSRAQSIFAR
jgi:cysteine desulfurase/selenocysteine lyase